jgi:hypothetical protein
MGTALILRPLETISHQHISRVTSAAGSMFELQVEGIATDDK